MADLGRFHGGPVMNDRFLPLTRRGLRCFQSGIGLMALGGGW